MTLPCTLWCPHVFCDTWMAASWSAHNTLSFICPGGGRCGAAGGAGITPSEAARRHPAYKTRICEDWQGGRCPRGETCTFAHGLGELRGFASPGQRRDVRPRHPFYCTLLGCRAEPRMGVQEYCDELLGGADERRSSCACSQCSSRSPPFPLDAQEEADAVRREGRRMTPSEAPQRPPAYKTRICDDWQGGRCPRGEACTFAHGLGELRSYASPGQQKDVRPRHSSCWSLPRCQART